MSVKVKAVCEGHDYVKGILLSRGALFKGLDHQIDTYFEVPSGSLKLREGNLENLVIYSNPKDKDVIVYSFAPNCGLKQIIFNSLKPLVVVYKSREIFAIDKVKFNLDNVKDLGRFIVIDVRDDHGILSYNDMVEESNYYTSILDISPRNFVMDSYANLLLKIRTLEGKDYKA